MRSIALVVTADVWREWTCLPDGLSFRSQATCWIYEELCADLTRSEQRRDRLVQFPGQDVEVAQEGMFFGGWASEEPDARGSGRATRSKTRQACLLYGEEVHSGRRLLRALCMANRRRWRMRSRTPSPFDGRTTTGDAAGHRGNGCCARRLGPGC